MQSQGFAVIAERINQLRFVSHFRAIHRGAFFMASWLLKSIFILVFRKLAQPMFVNCVQKRGALFVRFTRLVICFLKLQSLHSCFRRCSLWSSQPRNGVLRNRYSHNWQQAADQFVAQAWCNQSPRNEYDNANYKFDCSQIRNALSGYCWWTFLGIRCSWQGTTAWTSTTCFESWSRQQRSAVHYWNYLDSLLNWCQADYYSIPGTLHLHLHCPNDSSGDQFGS